MPLEQSYFGESIKRLSKLQEYMPNQPQCVYEFGGYLAKRLNSYPQSSQSPISQSPILLFDLEMACIMTMSDFLGDISKGLIERMNEYNAALSKIPDIADLVFPAEFAKEVKDYYKERYQQRKKF